MATGVLEGVRVVELGLYIATPMAGRVLADMGAEVIKVETVRAPDAMYRLPHWGMGMCRPEYDSSKLRMVLDVAHPEAVQLTRRLLEQSDVLMTNFRRRVLKRWGIDFPDIQVINPNIIILHQTSCGSQGPYSDYKFYGMPSQHATGVSMMTGHPQDALAAVSLAYSDFHCGIDNVMMIIASLLKRKRSGKGTIAESSVWKSGIVTTGVAALDYQANNQRLPAHIGNGDPQGSPHGIYPCKGEDRWCAITVFNDDEWKALCKVIGKPDLAKNPKYGSLADRLNNSDELDELIGKWTANLEAQEVMARMQAAGVPAGVVAQGQDLYDDEQLKARNFYHEADYYVPDPTRPATEWEKGPKPALAASVPINFSDTPVSLGRNKRMGEDTEYVCREILGLSQEEITRFREKGAVS